MVILQNRRARLLAHLTLMAHLLIEGVISHKVIGCVVDDLIGDTETLPFLGFIEGACELMKIAGECMDSTDNGKSSTDRVFRKLEDYPKRLQFSAQNEIEDYPKRLQSLVQDLLDSRAHHWRKS